MPGNLNGATMAMIPALIRFLKEQAAAFPIAGRTLTIGHQTVVLTPRQYEEMFFIPHPEPQVSADRSLPFPRGQQLGISRLSRDAPGDHTMQFELPTRQKIL
jgi:hypothetical protein